MKQIKTKCSHSAFMLIDATVGICICASAFILAFSFLHTLSPNMPISTYTTYKQLLSSTNGTQITINTLSRPTLTYQILELSYTHPVSFENLRLFIPAAIH